MAIGITNAGGANPKAFLLVNYPSGTNITVTVTNTYRRIAITSTQNLYYVSMSPSESTKTCVITLTNRTETVTKEVTVSKGAQVVVTIDFNLYVFYDGSPTGSGVFTLLGSVSERSGTDYYGANVEYEQAVFTANPINVTIYSTLHVKAKIYSSSRGSGDANYCAGLNSTQRYGGQWDTSFDSGIQTAARTSSGETINIDTSYDISALTGNYYYGITGWMVSGSYYDIYRIWLEY